MVKKIVFTEEKVEWIEVIVRIINGGAIGIIAMELVVIIAAITTGIGIPPKGEVLTLINGLTVIGGIIGAIVGAITTKKRDVQREGWIAEYK